MSESEVWDRRKDNLDLFKGAAGTRRLRDELVKMARVGITHIEGSLADVIKGEISVETINRNDPSHDFLHVMRMLKLAENMAVIGGDIDIIIAAIVMHDLVTYPKNNRMSVKEIDETVIYTRDLLTQMGFPDYKIPKVLKIINEISLSQGSEPSFTEGYIVYAADKLDQTGAIGIMRYCASGGQMNRELYNPEDPLMEIEGREPEVFTYTMDAIIERLPKIAKKLKQPFYRDTAQQRNAFFTEFCSELKTELDEEKNQPSPEIQRIGAKSLMNIFSIAGKQGSEFYNFEDPFCKNRKIEPEKYALDKVFEGYLQIQNELQLQTDDERKHVLKRKINFIQRFFSELKFEIDGELVLPKSLPKVDITPQ